MPIPFPGMNPYLEHPDLWPTVHQRLMTALADILKQQLPATYQIRLRERHYQVSGEDALVVGTPGLNWDVSSVKPAAAPPANHSVAHPRPLNATVDNLAAAPDSLATAPSRSPEQTISAPLLKRPIAVLIPVPQKIYETYLEVLDSTGEVVTVIESLSPKKKRPGRGRSLYERQREGIFGSSAHFVEIDLLRGWEPPSMYGPDEAGDYRILVSRSEHRPRAQLYTWTVMEPIPAIALPLIGHEEILFDLKPAVDTACDRTDLLVNYQRDPLPPLSFEESLWLETFLQDVGMRPCAAPSHQQAS